MLPLLLSDLGGAFRLLDSFTFRAGSALMTAFVICLIIGQPLINWLKARQGDGQPIRNDGPETHFAKQGTPTMGGAMILISIFGATVLWADLDEPLLWIALFVIGSYGLIGFADDWLKVTSRTTGGLSGRLRLFLEAVVAIEAAILFIQFADADPVFIQSLYLPFFEYNTPSDPSWNPLMIGGAASVILAMLVMVGSANAVNMTDGFGWACDCPCYDNCCKFCAYCLFGRHSKLCSRIGAPRNRSRARTCSDLCDHGRGWPGLFMVQCATG